VISGADVPNWSRLLIEVFSDFGTFVSFCMPVLNYPPDVIDVMENGDILLPGAFRPCGYVPQARQDS
jgi:hypothetical protein